jgi:hypothetical protein
MKEVRTRLTAAGMENVARRIRENYTYEGRWLKVPRKKREEFHLNLRAEAEKVGLTFAVCMELDNSFDSSSITHCEGSPNSYMMIKTNEGKFKPICNADCIRSCPNPREPPCGAPELALQYPFDVRTLQKRASSVQLKLSTT